MASPRLDELAAELLVEIARHLWLGDMSHLARVNRRLYQVLDPFLYLTDAKPYNQYALFWAAEHNLLTVAERALRAGTPVQPHNVAPSRLRPFGRIFTEQELRAAMDYSDSYAPLVIAAAAGHCAIAALLLRDPRLMGFLVVDMAIKSAAANDQVEMVDMLLWHVEHVHEESMTEVISSAFYRAVLQRNIAVIKLLIEDGARLAVIPRDLYSECQMEVAGAGHDELWDLLSSIRPLELVSNHRIQSEHLRFNLNSEVTGKGSRGIVELVETFTSLGFDWKCKGELARMLKNAFHRDNVPLLELLLSYSSDEQYELETLFASFWVGPGPEVCKWLLVRGFRRDVWDQAFARALGRQNIKGARLLLSIVVGIPAYIRDRGGEMLKAACSMGFLELAQLVLSPRSTAERRNLVQDAEAKFTGERSLLLLLMNPRHEGEEKRLEIARLVLEAGADPNSETPSSASPLKTACEKGLLRVARLLLKYGADPLQVTPNRFTILHVACRYCPNLALVEELLKRGADVMARCNNGTTPLHQLCWASSKQRKMGPMARYQVAKLLISNGADPNAIDVFGTAPLQVACSNESPRMGLEDAKVVVVLLEHGANIEQLGSSYKRPLFVACSSLNHSVASILLEKGADRSRETLRGFAKGYNELMLRDVDVYAHEMAKLLLSHGVDRAFVMEDMMNCLGHHMYFFETVRLLLMYGTDPKMDEPILPRNEVSCLRTEALAQALGITIHYSSEDEDWETLD